MFHVLLAGAAFSRIGLAIALCVCVGCGGPVFTSRMSQGDASAFTRLDSYADPEKAADLHYDQPVEWKDADLAEILNRLLLVERVGLLDRTPRTQSVFTSDEISTLLPRISQSFRAARSSEWVVFCLLNPSAGGQELTSGGLFVKERRLHIVLANHRELLRPEEVQAALTNPIRPVRHMGSSLTFDPVRFVASSGATWMGGSTGSSASEMILDYKAFLASLKPAGTFGSVPMQPQAGGADMRDLRDQVRLLKEEVERLKEQLKSQSDELSRLKDRRPFPVPR